MTDFQIRDLPEQTTATRRAQFTIDELKQFFDESYPRLAEAIGAQGLRVLGPPFARYHGMPSETFDVEAGMPVDGDFAPQEELRGGVLPGGPAIVGTYVGPYEGLASAWMDLQQWGAEQGLQPHGGSFWEVYVTDPGEEPDSSQWRTELVQPILRTD